jgi:TetR/AcrR family transcriptional regulator
MAAHERREEILAAAIAEFSEKGFHGGSTVTIAQRVGISQPNLFRLFPTKKALFIAAIERMNERLKRGMIEYGRQNPEKPLEAMAHGYRTLLADRELMLLLLQGYAACEDEEIRVVIRRVSAEIFTQIETMPGVSTRDAVEFYAQGMLLTVAAAMRLPEIVNDEDWAKKFLS